MASAARVIGVVAALWSLALAPGAAAAELRGHGGPVRALAADAEGRVLTGSFDTTAIVWSLESGAAQAVLRLHAGGVNAVALLPDGRVATGGQDGRVALWRGNAAAPEAVLEAHDGPVAALAVSPDGARLASAGWDGAVQITRIADAQAVARLETDAGPLTGVAFLPEGAIAAAGHDGTLRLWSGAGAATVTQTAAPINALAATGAGRIWAAGADGRLRGFDAAGTLVLEREISSAPLVSLALAPDAAAEGAAMAVGALDGTASLLDVDGAVLRALPIGGQPVWSLAFGPDATLLVAGEDNVVRAWDVATGEPLSPLPEIAARAPLGDSRGARVFRACVACHTLTPEDGNRAGPTLHGVFGRRIASAEGYDYSQALRGMDIVWTPETVATLFEVGPMTYTPGTKMPEQRITDPEDRAALIEFLKARTGGR